MDWHLIGYFLFLAGVLLGYMAIWFVASIILKRNDIADIAWGLGFVMLAWLSFVRSSMSTLGLLVTLLVTIWGVRLAWHIFKRNIRKPEDERYRIWRSTWKLFYLRSFFQVYLLQGALLFLIAVPVLYVNYSTADISGVILALGLIVWTTGFVFESIADLQLKTFIRDQVNKGKVMDQGL